MGRGIQLVVGLGNPGERYAQTRHNVGFMAVEDFVSRLGGEWRAAEKGEGLSARVELGGAQIRVAKPHTYMNASGEMVGPLARYFKIEPEEVLVVVDDFHLPLGRLRLRKKGSAGGQNGLDSILTHLGTQNVPRLRIGIGTEGAKGKNFVLGKFKGDERELVAEAVARAGEAIRKVCTEGIEAAMNAYNGAEA